VLAGKRARKPVVLKFVGDEAWERATQSGQTTKQLEAFLEAPEGGWRTKVFIAVQKFVLQRAAIVTTPSAYLGELLIQYYGVKRERVVVNYNAGTEHDEVPLARKPHQIFTAVRLVKWKGVEGIITALTALVSKFPDVSLVIAGQGPEEARLREVAEKIPGWQEHITFAGRLTKQEVLKVNRESGVQVLNSTYEGMPHGVLESFATKTPIIATNIPGTREAVKDGETGLLVPVGDDQALAAALSRIFTDAPLRERLTAGGSRILKEKFSWGAHLETLEVMFKKAFAAEA
jgi:glycosyltransferase involved in cell wall biosynthesis